MQKKIIPLLLFSFLISNDTSRTISTYKNGNVSTISYHEDTDDGQKVVRQETFHFTGSKAMEGNIEDDFKVGLWTYYYQNGKKRLEGNYIYGQKDGLWTYWYENGIKANQYTYKAQSTEGKIFEWHIDKECWTRSGNPCECGPSWWSDCEKN